jgi:hypothetical protein
MKCTKCNSQVSIADSKCPKCGHDLLQFGSTVSYERKPGYGQEIKDMVFGEVKKDTQESLKELDHNERRIFQPLENRLLSLFSRHISEEEIEEIFDEEIIIVVEEFSKNKDAEKIFIKIEENIKKALGFAFDHYRNNAVKIIYKKKGKERIIKGEDILAMLRAGEIIQLLGIDNEKDIDLSVKMFPFLKASEVACKLHSFNRYKTLRGNSEYRDKFERFVNHINSNIKNIIKDVPWLGRHKNPFNNFLSLIWGLLKGNDHYDLYNCRNTAFSLYFLGGGLVGFGDNNIFNTKGLKNDKSELAEKLCDLQALRNDRIHEIIEKDELVAGKCKSDSYDCLRTMPQILPI